MFASFSFVYTHLSFFKLVFSWKTFEEVPNSDQLLPNPITAKVILSYLAVLVFWQVKIFSIYCLCSTFSHSRALSIGWFVTWWPKSYTHDYKWTAVLLHICLRGKQASFCKQLYHIRLMIVILMVIFMGFFVGFRRI